jgi:hypothetical protein
VGLLCVGMLPVLAHLGESVQRATTYQFGEVTPLEELCSLGTNDNFAALFSDKEVLLITGNAVMARMGL